MAGEFRQCFHCGRKGTRQFVRYQMSWACRADKACERRRRSWNRRFAPPRPRRVKAKS